MTGSYRIPRIFVILAIVLPLAMVLGYFMSGPMEPSSLIVVALVLGALSIPLVMTSYHPMLILLSNACISLVFLPGALPAWMVAAAVGVVVVVLNRAVDSEYRLIAVPSITRSLIFLLIVVFGTAMLTGGVGMRAVGSSQYGGKRYLWILMAVVGYFVLTSRKIPVHRATFWVSAFFLGCVTAMVPDILGLMKVHSSILYAIFPPDFTTVQAVTGEMHDTEMFRIFGLTALSGGVFLVLLAKWGIKGIFDLTKPWRGILFAAVIMAGVYSGFRGTLVGFFLTFSVQFYLEGLHRTRLLPVLIGLAIVIAALVASEARRLPMVMQRTLSFLPIDVDPVARFSANASLDWRIDMWKTVLPQVPKHVLLGKGFAIDPSDLYFSKDPFGHEGYEWAIVAGDYHSGPLSTVIPLGVWGAIALVWFWGASLKYMYRAYRSGNPHLQLVNTLLLAAFVSRILFFLFLYGSFYSDLFGFTGIIGLSVSINGLPSSEKQLVRETAGLSKTPNHALAS